MLRWILTLILIYVTVGCAGDDNLTGPVDIDYEYPPAIYYSDEWTSFTYEEKIALLQVPVDTLALLPTERLIEIYMQFPLLGSWIGLDEYKTHIRRMKNGFNVVNEILQREDRFDVLLRFYDDMDINDPLLQWGTSLFDFNHIELLFAQEEVVAHLNKNQICRLFQACLKKYYLKFEWLSPAQPNMYHLGNTVGPVIGAMLYSEAFEFSIVKETDVIEAYQVGTGSTVETLLKVIHAAEAFLLYCP